FADRTDPWGAWSAIWCGTALAGVVQSVDMPGVSYLFMVPAATSVLAGALMLAGELEADRLPPVAHLPFLVVALLWIPINQLSFDALGFSSRLYYTLTIAAVVMPSTLPLLRVPGPARRWIAGVLLALAVLLGALDAWISAGSG